MASLVTPLRPNLAGGAQAFVCDLARELHDRGHEVALYCASRSQVPGVDLVEIEVPAGVAEALVMPGGAPPQAVAALGEGFERLFAELRRQAPDVVSQHAFDAEAIELAEGLRVLHTLHMPPMVPAVVEAARRSRAAFATVSEAARRDWSAVGLEPVRVLRNGIPDFGVEPRPPEPVAVIAGRISPEKGTAAALRVATAAGLEPLLLGEVYDRAYHEREVRLQPRAVGREELSRIMAGAAATLMPVEWEEPFGLVAAESQMAGCPVAGYRRGGLPEVVSEGVGGYLVEPGDEAGLVEAVHRAAGLDRAAIRRSALGRLLIGPAVAAYEEALTSLA